MSIEYHSCQNTLASIDDVTVLSVLIIVVRLEHPLNDLALMAAAILFIIHCDIINIHNVKYIGGNTKFTFFPLYSNCRFLL